MRYLIKSLVCLAVLAMSAAAFAPRHCAAAIYSFTPISTSSGASNAATVGNQITVQVTRAPDKSGAQQVDFKFVNAVGMTSSVMEVYFQDGPLIGAGFVVSQQVGATFQVLADAKVSPADLPGGGSLNPNFRVTKGFSADAGEGGPVKGLNAAGDWATFRFTLINNHTYDEVIAALAKGFSDPNAVWNANGSDKSGGPLGLRIGLHVISINGGASDSFINGARTDSPSGVVPEPASLGIWGLGLCIAALAGKRFRRRKAA